MVNALSISSAVDISRLPNWCLCEVTALWCLRCAQVSYQRGISIISLICNTERTSEILERVFRVLKAQGVNVKMMSQARHALKCKP